MDLVQEDTFGKQAVSPIPKQREMSVTSHGCQNGQIIEREGKLIRVQCKRCNKEFTAEKLNGQKQSRRNYTRPESGASVVINNPSFLSGRDKDADTPSPSIEDERDDMEMHTDNSDEKDFRDEV